MYGNAFVAEPAANVVSRIILSDDGRTLRARKAYDRAEFLTSTDERFRPVYLSNAPDGTLHIVDMYRGVIQQRADVTQYLRDYMLVERADKSIVPELVKLAGGAQDWRPRLHALWTLDGIDGIEPATAAKAIEDPSRDVRVAAIRIAERWLADANQPIQAAVLKRLDDAARRAISPTSAVRRRSPRA